MNEGTRVLIPRAEPPARADEFLTVPVPSARQALYRDVYTHFGWQVDAVADRGEDTTTMRLRRLRALRRGPVVDDQQRRAEQALQAIEEIDGSIDAWGTRARRAALTIGAVYAVLGAAAVMAGLAPTVIAVLLVLGQAHQLLAGPAASRARRLRARKVDPQLTEQRDIVEDAIGHARTALADGSIPRASDRA